MKSRRSLMLAVATLLLTGLGLGPARSALASHSAARAANVGGIDTTDVIAQWGFGDPQNEYAWGMAWFKGKLYVGTGRDVICVEKQTSDFYYPFSDVYNTHPEPSVHCAKNPYNLDLRAEIWQYTPQTGRWVMVYRAPANIPNPRAPGKYISPDIAYRAMSVVTDPHGRQVMFVSGVSADEYIPELATTHPPRLLRTYDGVHFQNIVRSSFIIHRTGQFTDTRPMGFRGIVQWRHQLYVVASTSLTGAGEVFRVDHPWSGYGHFTQVSPPWTQVFELQPFNGGLYLGTGNTNGYGVLRLSNSHRRYRIQQVVTDGAGRGKYMTSVVAMQVYRGWLYVSAAGWYCLSCNALPAAELIRIAPDGHWQVVAGAPRFVPLQSETKYPISGLGDGFDNIFTAHFWRMAVSGNALYVGTNDWSWLLQSDKSFLGGYPGLLDSLLSGEMGFDVWATCDGVDFFPVTRNAFGVDMYDFGVRTMEGVNGGFYIGSADHAHGTRIYHQPSNACAPFAGTARAGASADRVTQPAAPQGLLTDVHRRGTVVSWEPAAHARQYDVLRQGYTAIPFSFDSPPFTFPDGFLADDQVPIPAPMGSPGSSVTTLDVPGTYTSVGMTTDTYFVDRSRVPGAKYAYRVVAVSASGAQSPSSNVQVVPDPRPPATFAQLEAALPAPSAAVARAAAGSGGCARTLAELARQARTAGSDDARELAYRLERRLEYRNLAGGPTGGRLACG
jgi:hypothetical protein